MEYKYAVIEEQIFTDHYGDDTKVKVFVPMKDKEALRDYVIRVDTRYNKYEIVKFLPVEVVKTVNVEIG